MEKLDKELRKYFTCLYAHELNWEAISLNIGRPLVALKNQSEQLRLCERAEGADVALLAIPNLKTSLVAKIKSAIEAELALINDCMKEFEAATANLTSANDSILKCTEHMSLRPQFVEASATCPSRSDLVDWASDATLYYRVHLMQMSQAIARLDYQDEDNVAAFVLAFREDERLKNHIDKISATSKWFTLPQEVT